MKRGAFVGGIVGGVLGIAVAVCIVWIGLIFDDTPDGIAPLVMFGLFAAFMITAFTAVVGLAIGGIVAAISNA